MWESLPPIERIVNSGQQTESSPDMNAISIVKSERVDGGDRYRPMQINCNSIDIKFNQLFFFLLAYLNELQPIIPPILNDMNQLLLRLGKTRRSWCIDFDSVQLTSGTQYEYLIGINRSEQSEARSV